MIPVEEALSVARAIAAQSGDGMAPRDERIAAVMERLLVEFELRRYVSEHYQQLLKEWGIPHKQAIIRKRESGGFEIGWDN